MLVMLPLPMIGNNDVDVATVGAADDAADDTTDDEDTPHARQCLCLWHRLSACWTCPCPSASMYHHWCQAARPGPYDIIVVANIDATMPDGIAVAIASVDAHTADDSTSTAVAIADAVVAIAANVAAAIAVDIAVDAVHDDTDGVIPRLLLLLILMLMLWAPWQWIWQLPWLGVRMP